MKVFAMFQSGLALPICFTSALLAAACASSVPTNNLLSESGPKIKLIESARLLQLKQQTSTGTSGNTVFYRDTVGIPRQLQKYLSSLSSKLIAATKILNHELKFEILECSSFNDHSIDSNTIRLCLDTVRSLQAVDELAFLIAHEMAHVFLRHQRSDREIKEKNFQNTMNVASFLPFASSFVHASGKAEFAALIKKQESEADFFAADMLVEAGMNPNAGIALLGLLDRRKKSYELMAEKRKQQTKRQLNARMVDVGNVVSSSPMNALLLPFVAPALAFEATQKMIDTASANAFDSSTHNDPSKRQQALASYIGTFHADRTVVAVSKVPWRKTGKGGKYREISNFFEALDRSEKLVGLIAKTESDQRFDAAAKGRWSKIAGEYKKLRNGVLNKHAETLTRSAYVEAKLGNISTVDSLFRKLVKLQKLEIAHGFFWGFFIAQSNDQIRRNDYLSQTWFSYYGKNVGGSLEVEDEKLLTAMDWAASYALLGDVKTSRKYSEVCKNQFAKVWRLANGTIATSENLNSAATNCYFNFRGTAADNERASNLIDKLHSKYFYVVMS